MEALSNHYGDCYLGIIIGDYVGLFQAIIIGKYGDPYLYNKYGDPS
jgi:hypothetical protein